LVEIFQLSASNVSGQTVTLPRSFDLLTGVELLNTGNYPAASAVAPASYSVVSTTPSAGQVQFTAPNSLTFPTGVTLDTTYGTCVVRGYTRGQIQRVS
jgi:hypothetical protein